MTIAPNHYATIQQFENEFAELDARLIEFLKQTRERVREMRAATKQKKAATHREIFEAAVIASANNFGVWQQQILSRTRCVDIADARQVAMALTYEGSEEMSFPQVGKMFKRHHGTIINAVRAVQNKRETDPRFRAKVEAVERELDRVLNGQEAK